MPTIHGVGVHCYDPADTMAGSLVVPVDGSEPYGSLRVGDDIQSISIFPPSAAWLHKAAAELTRLANEWEQHTDRIALEAGATPCIFCGLPVTDEGKPTNATYHDDCEAAEYAALGVTKPMEALPCQAMPF